MKTEKQPKKDSTITSVTACLGLITTPFILTFGIQMHLWEKPVKVAYVIVFILTAFLTVMWKYLITDDEN